MSNFFGKGRRREARRERGEFSKNGGVFWDSQDNSLRALEDEQFCNLTPLEFENLGGLWSSIGPAAWAEKNGLNGLGFGLSKLSVYC